MPDILDTPPVHTTVGNYFIGNYPPFSCWNAGELPKFQEALARTPAPGPLAFYVHIPFCRQRCHYCYFRVYPRRNRADVDTYIDALLKELSLYQRFPAVQGRPFKSVYFGGGSPSYLEPDQIRRLFGGLQKQSDWSDVEECTVECEPGSVTPEKLAAFKEFGVTRISIGFQSLNDDILRGTGRDVTADGCRNAFHMARAAGFDDINVDLLAGLPGEDEEGWRRTVRQALDLQPDSITIYQLELTHNSKLYSTMRAGRTVELPSWPAKRRWTDAAFSMCEEARYELGSSYIAARDLKRWRCLYTFDHSWRGSDLLALGEASFGHFNGVHYQNTDTFQNYVESLAGNTLPLRRALALSGEEKLRREVILQLKLGVLDAAYYRKKFGVELTGHFQDEFETLANHYMVEIDGDAIRLTREGLFQADRLGLLFYLPEHTGVRYT